MAREPGYYWITNKESGRQLPAQWDGEYWYFIGSLHMVRDDDVDDDDRSDDPETIMSRYEIGARITPPT